MTTQPGTENPVIPTSRIITPPPVPTMTRAPFNCQQEIGKAFVGIGVVLIIGSLICLKMNWLSLLYMLSILWLIIFFIILICATIAGGGEAFAAAGGAGGELNPAVLVVMNIVLGIVFIGIGADMMTTSNKYVLKCT